MTTQDTAVDLSRLTVEIRNSRPIELSDLTASLNALASQYQRFAVRTEMDNGAQAKLYVQEIRPGSVIAELVSYVVNHHGDIVAATRAGASVIAFAKQIQQTAKELLRGEKPSDPDLAPKDLKDFKRILETTAKDPSGAISIRADNGSTVEVNITLNSLEANAIQNRAQKEIELAKETSSEFRGRVVFQWHTASVGTSQKSSGRGVIKAISSKPLPVYIDDPETKAKMVAGKSNPFLLGFIVDVELLTLDGTVKGYRILALHDALEDDPDETDVS